MLTSVVLCLIVGVADGDTLTARCGEPGAYSQERVRLAAYSTRWRTRFHADGGQCSSVMADTVPR